MRFARITLAGAVALAVGLAACSSDKKEDGGSATTASVEVTTTIGDTTTVPATTAPTTEAPTTPAPTTVAPATSAPAPGYSLYDEVDAPTTLPSGHTHAFAPTGVLADGVYWVSYTGGAAATPSITIFQAFFGDECISKAAEVGGECNNDYFVLDPPSRDINDLPFAPGVWLTVADMNTMLSHWITPVELAKIATSSPSAGAPAGFEFIPFPFIMTVTSGEITAFEQLWVP